MVFCFFTRHENVKGGQYSQVKNFLAYSCRAVIEFKQWVVCCSRETEDCPRCGAIGQYIAYNLPLVPEKIGNVLREDYANETLSELFVTANQDHPSIAIEPFEEGIQENQLVVKILEENEGALTAALADGNGEVLSKFDVSAGEVARYRRFWEARDSEKAQKAINLDWAVPMIADSNSFSNPYVLLRKIPGVTTGSQIENVEFQIYGKGYQQVGGNKSYKIYSGVYNLNNMTIENFRLHKHGVYAYSANIIGLSLGVVALLATTVGVKVNKK